MNKSNNKMEFSKKMLVVMALVTGFIIIFSCYLMFITRDTSALAYLIPSIFAELGIGTGFYYNKAKAENQIKLNMEYKKLGLDMRESEEIANG